MNIICSSCVGARIYQYYNKQFNNPFTWNMIDTENIIQIMCNYDSINFNNFDITIDENNKCVIKYDDKITVLYPHYIFDERYNHILKNDINLLGKDIVNYIKDIMTRRISRFNIIKNTEKHVFILDDSDNFGIKYSETDIQRFIDFKTNYRKILITSCKKYKNIIRINGTVIVFHEKLKMSSFDKAKLVIKKLQKLINFYK